MKFYPWGVDGMTPSHEICDCCGCEFGYEDISITSIKSNRQKWIESGSAWFDSTKKPVDWSLEIQLKSIPNQYQ